MAVTDAPSRSDFGAGHLFLADSRLAFTVLNQVRYGVLMRVFGVSRAQANLLTFVLALAGGQTAVTTAGRVARAPLRVSKMDVAMGGFTMRQGAIGIAGPSAAGVSPFATLVGLAIVSGVAIPALRRGAHGLRAGERRVRTLRERQYSAASRSFSGGGAPAA